MNDSESAHKDHAAYKRRVIADRASSALTQPNLVALDAMIDSYQPIFRNFITPATQKQWLNG